jgi:hypothetical protein
MYSLAPRSKPLPGSAARLGCGIFSMYITKNVIMSKHLWLLLCRRDERILQFLCSRVLCLRRKDLMSRHACIHNSSFTLRGRQLRIRLSKFSTHAASLHAELLQRPHRTMLERAIGPLMPGWLTVATGSSLGCKSSAPSSSSCGVGP